MALSRRDYLQRLLHSRRELHSAIAKPPGTVYPAAAPHGMLFRPHCLVACKGPSIDAPRVRDALRLRIPAKFSALIHSVISIPCTSNCRTKRLPSALGLNFADSITASAIFRPARLNGGVSGVGAGFCAPGDGL